MAGPLCWRRVRGSGWLTDPGSHAPGQPLALGRPFCIAAGSSAWRSLHRDWGRRPTDAKIQSCVVFDETTRGIRGFGSNGHAMGKGAISLCAPTPGLVMPLLPRKGVLAIAAVIDIALNARYQPVQSKALARRLRLPPRHLETVLYSLVRYGILKGTRGLHGGYQLAREQDSITAGDILRAAIEENFNGVAMANSSLLDKVVMPALTQAENAFSGALARITVEDLTHSAKGLGSIGTRI